MKGKTANTYHNIIPTRTRKVNMVNTPGHKEYIKNVISGVNQSDCALLMVSSIPTELEASLAPEGQTKDHALFSFAFGLRTMIVCCNKIDSK